MNKEYDNILYNIHTSNISYNNIHVYDVYTDDIRSDIDAYRPHIDKYYHTLASIKDTSSQLSRVDHHISSISSSIARYIQKISHKDIIDLSNPDTHDNTYVDHTEDYRRRDNEDIVKLEGGEEEDTHGQRGEVQKGRLDIYDFDEYDEYSVAEVPLPRTDSVKVSSSYRNSLIRKVYNRWRDHTANIRHENEEKRRMVLSKLYSNMKNSKDIHNKIHESHTSRLVSSCFSLWMDRWKRYREVHGRISRMYDRNISTRCLTVIRDVCNSSASGRVYAQRHRLHVLRTSYKHMIEYRDMKRAQKTLMESVMRIRYDKYRRQLLFSFKRNTRIVYELKCMSGRYRNRVLNDAYRCIADNAREEISYRSSILKMSTVLDSLLHRNVSSSFHSISLIYYTHNRHAHVYISSYR